MNCENLFGMNWTKVNNSENLFFKYKAAKLGSIPVLGCEEFLELESISQLFKLMDEYYLKLFNVKLEYVPIPYAELTTKGSSIIQMQNVSGVIFPVELSDIAKDDFWYHSPVFLTSELLLLTGPPAEVEKYSMSFLTVDTAVSCLLLLSIFVLPLLAKLSKFVTDTGQGIRQDQTSIRRKVRNYLNLSWDFVSTFFFEPFLRVPKCISWRITVGSWLIAISIISIFMGSALKTELYSTEHVLIDSLESFSKYTNAKIGLSSTDNAGGFFKEWQKSIMDSQPELSLASRVKYMDVMDFMDVENYHDVFLGRAGIFVPQFYLETIMAILLEGDEDLRKLTFYFNTEQIKNLLYVFPNSRELKKCPAYIEQMSLGMYMATETKFVDYLLFKNNFYISRAVWKKPTKLLKNRGAYNLKLNIHNSAS